MMSLRMLNHCAVMVVTDTQKLLEDKKLLAALYSRLNRRCFLDFKPTLRKEHGRLYQLEFGNRWVGAYRSIALKGTNMVLAAPLLMLESKA